MYDREAWQALRDNLRAELWPLLAAEGMRQGEYSADFVSEGADVSLNCGPGASGWDVMVVKVQPSFRLGSRRPSIYRMKVADATPKAVADVARKAVNKAREFQEAMRRATEAYEESARAKVAAARLINDFMRERFPEFKQSYGNVFESGADMGVRLEAHVEGSSVRFKFKVEEWVSAEEAREVVDFLARLEAARVRNDASA